MADIPASYPEPWVAIAPSVMRSQSNDVRPVQEFSLVLSERIFIELATANNK